VRFPTIAGSCSTYRVDAGKIVKMCVAADNCTCSSSFGQLLGGQMGEVWAVGEAYEGYVGRWSRRVAVHFLDWLDVGPQQRWLDVGCGTGVLTAAILDRCDPAGVLGIDSSTRFVAWARENVDAARARFEVGDAAELPADSADVVVSGLLLTFLPDPAAAVSAMRAAAPNGLIAAYVWDYAERMELMRYFWDAAVALDPGAEVRDEGKRFSISRPDRLEALWRDVGLVDVTVRAIEVPTVFRDFDDYWTPFLGGQGPAPSYVMSLDDEGRDALRRRLRDRLPVAADGSIPLVARAWAIRGRSPARN
jgi:trans-aconitate methyltransferase